MKIEIMTKIMICVGLVMGGVMFQMVSSGSDCSQSKHPECQQLLDITWKGGLIAVIVGLSGLALILVWGKGDEVKTSRSPIT